VEQSRAYTGIPVGGTTSASIPEGGRYLVSGYEWNRAPDNGNSLAGEVECLHAHVLRLELQLLNNICIQTDNIHKHTHAHAHTHMGAPDDGNSLAVEYININI